MPLKSRDVAQSRLLSPLCEAVEMQSAMSLYSYFLRLFLHHEGAFQAAASEEAGDKSTLEDELYLLFSPWKHGCHSVVISSKSNYGHGQISGGKKAKLV